MEKKEVYGRYKLSEIQKNPILKPIGEYEQGALSYQEQDKRETEYLKDKMVELDKLLDTGIFENSTISKYYQAILEIHKRLLSIYQKNVFFAEEKIDEMKNNVEEYYILKDDGKDTKDFEEIKEEKKKPKTKEELKSETLKEFKKEV